MTSLKEGMRTPSVECARATRGPAFGCPDLFQTNQSLQRQDTVANIDRFAIDGPKGAGQDGQRQPRALITSSSVRQNQKAARWAAFWFWRRKRGETGRLRAAGSRPDERPSAEREGRKSLERSHENAARWRRCSGGERGKVLPSHQVSACGPRIVGRFVARKFAAIPPPNATVTCAFLARGSYLRKPRRRVGTTTDGAGTGGCRGWGSSPWSCSR